jgi:hypothetical protein
MNLAWKRWFWTGCAIAICVAAFFLNARAWHAGHEASLAGLYQCSFWCFPLLFLAWVAVLAPFTPPLEGRTRERPTWTALWTIGVFFIALGSCVSAHVLWVAVLLMLLVVLLWLVAFAKVRRGPTWKGLGLHAALSVGLFMLTWDRCSTTTERFLNGFGTRIDDTCGADRLMAWAQEVIENPPANARGGLSANDYPQFVRDLMNSPDNSPWPEGWVAGPAGEHATVVIANGSGYGFGITIRPSGSENGPGTGGTLWITWRPGLFLHTVAK